MISEKGKQLIKSFEGCRLTAYKALPSEKYYTIGYGHYGPDVKQGQTITQAQADALLDSDLVKYEKYVDNTGLKLNTAQRDALVSFTYNCGAGNLKKLTAGRTLEEIGDALLLYNKAGGKELKGLTRRRKAEQALYNSYNDNKNIDKNTDVYFGSARHDEHGKYTNGQAGDQLQKSSPDYIGEVSMQKAYKHSKGWTVLRVKDYKYAEKIADAMKTACNNSYIGYSQNKRNDIIAHGIDTNQPTQCDCSSLIRAVIIKALDIDVGDFYTGNEKDILLKSGYFVECDYRSEKYLQKGDILVTKQKGHTVAVTDAPDFPYLCKGSRSNAVKMVQLFINTYLNINIAEDGIFGDNTEKAVKEYQKIKGLTSDGLVGSATYNALGIARD